MCNLKPAPLWLTPQVVRATLGCGAVRGMETVPVQSLSDCGSRCSDIRMAIVQCFAGCEPGVPTIRLLAARAKVKQAAVFEHLEALRAAGLITPRPFRLLTEKGRILASENKQFAAKIVNVRIKTPLKCEPGAGNGEPDHELGTKRCLKVAHIGIVDGISAMNAGSIPAPAKPKDWITERRERLESAIRFLRSKAVLVQLIDRNHQIAKYRVSGKRFPQFAEEVIEIAMVAGWAK